MKITLTENEKSLFLKIKSLSTKLNLTPRVAGGWVRDKLLHLETSDIDIVIDRMSGYDFVQALKAEYAGIGGIGKIKVNPAKSKHLETAVAIVDNFSVDFLSLRSESYSGSRIPVVSPAIASEDAFRRDVTVNALFYNLMSGEIEDFTGMGIRDLESKILRTPLNPKTTFCDDPLRILRVLRFSVKFNFAIEPATYNAMKSRNVKIFLETKVSNERIGKEIFKILECENAYDGLLKIVDCGLVRPIFKHNVEISIDDLKRFFQVNLQNPVFASFTKDELFIRNLYLILIFTSGKLSGKTFLNVEIVSNALMFPKTYRQRVIKIEENLEFLERMDTNTDLTTLIHLFSRSRCSGNKVLCYEYHRKLVEICRKLGNEWKVSVNIYLRRLKMGHVNNKCAHSNNVRNEDHKDVDICSKMDLTCSEGVTSDASAVEFFLQEILENQYEKRTTTFKKIPGNEIKEILSIDSKEIRTYIELGTVYSIIYPGASKQDIIEYLVDERKRKLLFYQDQ